MAYYVSTTIEAGFNDAIELTRASLEAEGFGIVTQIDIRRTLANALGVEFRSYTILGACNPAMAYEALQIEDKVGTMLPCNVVVQDVGDGRIEIAAINPVASMQAIDNDQLIAKARAVGDKLSAAVKAISEPSTETTTERLPDRTIDI